MEETSRRMAELALFTSDKTINYARISQPEKIENLELSSLYNMIIKNKKERRGVVQKVLKSGLGKDLEQMKSLKVLLLDGSKQPQDASLTFEKEHAFPPENNQNSIEMVVYEQIPFKKVSMVSVTTVDSSTQTTDFVKSIKMVDKSIQTLDFTSKQIMGPQLKRKMLDDRNEYTSAPEQRSILKRTVPPNNVVDENIYSSVGNNNTAKTNFMSARDVLIEQDTRRLGAQPSGLKRLGNGANRPLLSLKKTPIESEKSIAPNNQDQNDDRLKNIDPKMVEAIRNEIQCNVSKVSWDDIAGLDHAKKSIMEVVCWPMLRPDLFSGIRAPPKGLLLFGPPGTGKTLIGKCVASSVKATFFSISSSTLTSKWIGDGEKMVRALFAVARVHQPSVVFVDEIDSLLTQRSEGENEATRRIKTEFLVQFDGCGTQSEDRILVIGATNRPGEIDEAARRRFRKKLYIPLPDSSARRKIIENLLKPQKHDLSTGQIDDIILLTEGYSGSDMDGLIREASLEPLRDVHDIANIREEDVRPINHSDFIRALRQVRASVAEKDLSFYLKFDEEFGSGNS